MSLYVDENHSRMDSHYKPILQVSPEFFPLVWVHGRVRDLSPSRQNGSFAPNIDDSLDCVAIASFYRAFATKKRLGKVIDVGVFAIRILLTVHIKGRDQVCMRVNDRH